MTPPSRTSSSTGNATLAVTLVALMATFGLLVGCGSGQSEVSSTTSTSVSNANTTDGATTDKATADTLPTATEPPAPADVVLFDFAGPASVEGWSTQNDTVMGGVSSATVGWSDGALVFAGDLSLANNGGFTSAVSPQDAAVWARSAGAGSLVVNGTGDGRTYVVQLRGGRDAQQRWTQSFTLPTTPGEAVLPFELFEATDFRLDPVAPEPVDPATIVAVAVYLVDGQTGVFGVAITSMSVR